MSVTDGRTKKYNHVSIIGFVQTGLYRFSTRDISGEPYIIRKWQKRVPRGPLPTDMFYFWGMLDDNKQEFKLLPKSVFQPIYVNL